MSRYRWHIIGWSITLLLLVGCGRTSGRLTVAGSTTAMHPVGILAEVYEKQGGPAFAITPVGSTAGVLALERGMADLAMVSRALTPDEKARGLREIPIGQDLLVVVVHPTNPVDSLTKADLRRIWERKARSWREFGGLAIGTVPHGREYGSGAHAIWSRVIGTENYNLPIAPESSFLRREAMIDPRAITYIGLRSFRLGGVKAIRVDGLAHTDPGYPLRYPISLVVGPSSPPAAWGLVRFARTASGQRIVEDEGLMPLEEAELATPVAP